MIEIFKGIRNDLGTKHIGTEFMFDASNFNNDSIVGADSILYPEQTKEISVFGAEQLKQATLYNMEDDTSRVDFNVSSQNITAQGRTESAHHYINNTSYSTLNTTGINGKDLIFSFWADGVDTSKLQSIFGSYSSSGFGCVTIPYGINKMYLIRTNGAFQTTRSYSIPDLLLHHFVCIFDTTNNVNNLYIDGVLQVPVLSITNVFSTFTLTNMFAGTDSLTYDTNNNLYDFSILDLSKLSSYSNQQIATYLYNNTFYNGGYAFVYEYPLTRVNQDGLVEYRYLDSNSIPQKVELSFSGGCVYDNCLQSPVLLKSGMSTGLVQTTVFNDKLLIVNGKDYPLWYRGETGNFFEMGACEANQGVVGGALNGTYYYAVTYVDAGGEKVLGTVSNTITISGHKVNLTLPIPYSATLTRKIYRTEAGGTQLKLLTSIADATTLSYVDNNVDGTLEVNIPAINNEMIKPYFVESIFDKITMTVIDKYPTQVFIASVSGNEVIDPTSDFIDLSNQASDNTKIVGMEIDYNNIIVGTNKNIVMIDPSGATASITYTRSNVGVLNGYSMCRVPANGNFDGGVMFVSTLGDVRLISGYKNIIPNTVNDISTENMAQVIYGTFPSIIKSAPRIYSCFYDYKYHLIAGNLMFIMDIRTESWWKYDIRTDSYQSRPTVLAVMNDTLYNGQVDGWIERMYASIDYRDEDVVSRIESGTLAVSEAYKFIKNWQYWFYTSPNTEVNLEIIVNDDISNSIKASFVVGEGYFNPMYFSGIFYDTGESTEDYREIHINSMARWVKFIITCTKGRMYFRGYSPDIELLKNKEA